MKLKTAIVAITALTSMLLFTSCEAIIYGEGRIFDAQTLEPLDSVFCENGRSETYSDSTGFYDLHFGWITCTFGCKDIEFSYSKPGYQSQKINNPAKQDIFLWKE